MPTDGLSDPGYLSPGYIDVLFSPGRDRSITHDGHEHHLLVSKPTLRTTNSTTSSYAIDQYDPERWIPVVAAASANESCFDAKKRKREDSFQMNEWNFHHASWNVFQYYLDRCLPVKIANASSFRDISLLAFNERNGESNTSYSDVNNNNEKRKETDRSSGEVLCHVASLPSTILDTMVTVQCAFSSETSTQEDLNDSPQELDRAISFCTKHDVQTCPTFMGQEDQVTSEMTLKEVISWERIKSQGIDDTNPESAQDGAMVSMAICVAQEPIITISSSCDKKDLCQGESQIKVQLDGRVGKKEKHDETATISAAVPPLAPMAKMLRIPSYLLLGNPEEIDNGNTKSSDVTIHDINLWHAPQNCCTNIHYDDRDNLLLVTEGVKTVEICPPGCIEASPIYSEHANHPAVLRRARVDLANFQSKQTILELKRRRTHIVSVSAGQALYIPPGWWHRVESERACTAVNVWFEYKDTSSKEVPKHMVDFRHRQTKRKYYEKHESEWATSYLEALRRGQLGQSNHRKIYQNLSFHPVLKQEDWISMRDTAFGDGFLEAKSKAAFVNVFIRCWEKCIDTFCEILGDKKHSLHEFHELTFIPSFAAVLNAFLLGIQLDRPKELQVLVRMWAQFPPPQQKRLRATSFAGLIKHLQPASCYVITGAWERHASAVGTSDCNGTSNQTEVEKSYKHFFNMFGDEYSEKTMRLHLLGSVETFKKDMCNMH